MDSSVGNEDSRLIPFTKIEDVFKLLEDSEQASRIYCKDIVLLLGNTGSGKSTFAKFIAADNSKLESIEYPIGGGDYVITDNENKIGHGIKSKTILPEQVIDLDSNIAYCDCPGFGDTRNPAYDISSTYYMKNVLNQANSVKIVLMVLHSSVRAGYDRTDFIELIKHIIEFMRNIENFEDSIALVVTKVEDYHKTKEQIIINIVHFLGTVKETLVNDLISANSIDYQKDQFNKKAISLIDIFLTKTMDKYEKILIFRKPCEGGILSNIKLIQNDKTYLKTLLENSIVFTPMTAADFGFTVSAASKNVIIELVIKINEKITFEIEELAQDLNKYVESHMRDSDDLICIKEKFCTLHTDLERIIKELEKSITITEFIVTLTNYIDSLNIKKYRNTFLNMLKNCKYLQFLEKIIDDKVNINALKWSHPLRDFVQKVEKSKKWYSFLFNINQKMTYELYFLFFENKKNILQDIRENTKKPGNKIIDLLRKCNVGYNFDICDIDEIKTRHLYDTIQILLNEISFEHADSNTLLIKGDFIKLSDIENYLKITTHEIKCIEIFALNTFFINTDFIKLGSQMKLFVIAPTWEVINDRRIVLDGSPGAALPCDKAIDEQDGLPGLPGGPAGSFIGICHKIVNSNHLTISANGGIGGTGQDGGDGRPGTDGHNEEPCGDRPTGLSIMTRNGGYDKLTDSNGIRLEKWHDYATLFMGITANKGSELYVMYGNKGTVGGDGGQGGCGGKGGFRGTVSILGLHQGQIKISNQNGGNGKAGRSGKGGMGGKNTYDVIYEYQETRAKLLFYVPVTKKALNWQLCYEKTEVQEMRAASGRYTKSKNVEGLKNPENTIVFKNNSHVINKYKRYVWHNLNNSVKKRNLTEFYLHLHHNTDIKQTYDVFGFLDELQNYEAEFHHIHKFCDLHLFYKFLLQRIIEFAENKNEISHVDNKLLNYLYTACLSKIINMKNKSTGDLIIDIDNYLKHVLNNFKTLEKCSFEMLKLECSRDYTQNIEVKIEEALQFIENHITLEIEDVSSQLGGKLQHLLHDILKMRENAGTEKQILQLNRKLLNKLIVQNELLGNFSWFHKFLNIILTCAKTVGSIIQTASKVALSLGLDKLGTKNVIASILIELFKQVDNGTNFIKKLVIKKCEVLLHFLDNVLQNINNFPGKLMDITSLVKDIRNKVIYFMENVDNVNITSYLSEIMPHFEKLKQMFTNTVDKCENNITFYGAQPTPQILQMLKTLCSGINIAEVFPNVYDKFKHDELQLAKIGELIQQEDNKINMLQQFEIALFKSVFPLFINIENDVTKLKGQSRVALNISNWKIQSSFKEMQTILSGIVKDFQMDVELTIIADGLKEAIFTQITIYDRIQEYSEHKELADYIANMSSEQSMAIRTSNAFINETLARLDFTIKSNIAISQYEKTLSAFKQFIFPFAQFYIKEFNSEINVNYEAKFEDIIADIRQKIESLKDKLAEKKLSVNRTLDQCVFYENFKSEINSNKPFYCWDNEIFLTAITNLLSGKEILLKADVLYSFPDKNAIKFNEIQINLKTRDESLNEKLKKALEHFDVEMTHYGNSYFRFDNKFYILSSEKMTFHHSFEKDESMNPVRENEVNRKIKAKHFILSPYATWSFQLKSADGTRFSDLEEFKGKVSLELVGYGQYVGMENDISGEELQKYYKCIDVMSVTDVIDNKNYATISSGNQLCCL